MSSIVLIILSSLFTMLAMIFAYNKQTHIISKGMCLFMIVLYVFLLCCASAIGVTDKEFYTIYKGLFR